MANPPVHHESAQATERRVSLHDACLNFEDLALAADELSCLLDLLASAEIPERVQLALRGCATLAHTLSDKANEYGQAYLEAHNAERNRDGTVTQLR